LPAVAGVAAALAIAGVAVPEVWGGTPIPGPSASLETVRLFAGADAAPFASLFTFASSAPLAIFSASVASRLHALGVRAAGPTIALAGGVAASVALAASACVLWALARAGGDAHPWLIVSMRDLAFAAGGPWHVVALGLLVAGVAVSSAYHRLLPAWLCTVGIAAAFVCELATFAFVSDTAAAVVPVGRFGGLAWLVAAAVSLPRSRRRAASPDHNARPPALSEEI
jgi:hypothetical protein